MIIHFDLDAFYAAVEERLDPTLQGEAFIVAQKNCVATLSYPARALGLKKLMAVTSVLEAHPTMRVINGESLAKYRKAGKEMVKFVKRILPTCPIERLGLEEMWIDLSKLVSYNIQQMHATGLVQLIEESNDDDDVEEGVNIELGTDSEFSPLFCEEFVTGGIPGAVIPSSHETSIHGFVHDEELFGLYVATWIAEYVQARIYEQFSYTASVGVAKSKILAKMVGSYVKPNGLTTLLPEHTQSYLDPLPISTIPFCGSKLVEKIKNELASCETPTVEEVRRQFSKPELETLQPSLWELITGTDATPVHETPIVPQQISIEDSYWFHQCHTVVGCRAKIKLLVESLVAQVVEDAVDVERGEWIAIPATLRVLVRLPKVENIKRKAKQIALPKFILKLCTMGLDEDAEERAQVVEKITDECLKLVRQLTSGQKDTDVELINVALTGFKVCRP